MDIENLRFLLSALIQALPTVVSIALVAFFAFPKKGKVKRQSTYIAFLFVFIALILVASVTIYFDVITLLHLEKYVQQIQWINIIVGFSLIPLFGLPILLAFYLIIIGKYKLEG